MKNTKLEDDIRKLKNHIKYLKMAKVEKARKGQEHELLDKIIPEKEATLRELKTKLNK